MPATLSWHDDKQTILVCTFTDGFGIDNYAVLEGQLPMLVREKPHQVDVIFYLAKGSQLPNLSGILQEIGIICRVMPENFNYLILVGNGLLLTNPISIAIATWFKNRYYQNLNHKIHIASSLDSAIEQCE